MRPDVRAESARGAIAVRWLAPGVMCTTITGHCDDALADVHVTEARAAYAEQRQVQHFFDVEGLESYDSSARVALTRFAIDQRAHVAAAIFLVRSRLVAMGVSTAALAARLVGLEFVVLSERAEFDRRLRRASAC